MAQGYNRWLCERILSAEPRLISMLYLPFNDPEAAYKDRERVRRPERRVRLMVTSPRYKPVHDNAYGEDLRAARGDGQADLVPRRYNWNDQSLSMTNRFISVHAPLHVVQHGPYDQLGGQRLPERFPKLKVMWVESG